MPTQLSGGPPAAVEKLGSTLLCVNSATASDQVDPQITATDRSPPA